MSVNNLYYEKYLKYKNKYLNLQSQIGGYFPVFISIIDAVGQTSVVPARKYQAYAYNKYFESNIESTSKMLEFIKTLVKKQILFKSNLSRGLLLLYNNWKDLVDDFNNPDKKMKELLISLKNLGITKNLENLLQSHKIEYISE